MITPKRIKLLMAGMLFPAVFLPLAYSGFYLAESDVVRAHPLQFIPMFIPLLFGLANIIRAHLQKGQGKKEDTNGYFVTGIVLGLLVAYVGINYLRVPSLLFGLTGCNVYLPFIFIPVIYALIFRFIVRRLNQLLGV